MLQMYIESTEEELGRIRSQISTNENESKLKLEQGSGDLLKSIQSAEGALQAYLDQKQIRSPIPGVISDLSVDLNSQIEINKPFSKIIPENSQIMTAIHVFSKDVVKISVGQPVVYKVEAYPYQNVRCVYW